jgi:hypothetical protein
VHEPAARQRIATHGRICIEAARKDDTPQLETVAGELVGRIRGCIVAPLEAATRAGFNHGRCSAAELRLADWFKMIAQRGALVETD